MDIFQAVKQHVSMEAVAERYGLTIKKGKALCPFHNDTNPSLSIKNSFFHCFVCDAGGDQIAFVSKLFDLPPIEAANQIVTDFGLASDSNHITAYQVVQKKRKQEEKQKFIHWETDIFQNLARAYRDIVSVMESHRGLYRTTDLDSVLQRYSRTGYFLNILTFGTKEEKEELYQNYKKEVEELAHSTDCANDRRLDR